MNTDKIVNFFFEMATLRRITRSWRQTVENVSDNVSDHSFRVAVFGMVLAQLEKCDENKVLKMCLFHDIAEARVGDANIINKQYVDLREGEAIKDQLKGLPIEKEILELFKEYEERKSKEAIVAKDADVLDQILLEQEYFYKDEKNRKIWQDYAQKSLQTESAKKLTERIRKSNPFECPRTPPYSLIP